MKLTTNKQANRRGSLIRVPVFLFLSSILFQPISYASDETLNNYCDHNRLQEQSSNVEPLAQHIEHGDNIERKKLRLLLLNKPNGCLISGIEKNLLEQYAELNEYELSWVHVDTAWDLLPELVADKGDIIVSQDQGFTASMQGATKFTLPWGNAVYKIVERSDNSHISRYEDLAGRQVASYKDTAVWYKLLQLEETIPGLVLEEIPENVPYNEVMQRVKIGEYDLALVDSLFLDTYLPLNPELQANFEFSEERNMAWTVSADNEDLLKSLNQYLNQQHLTLDVESIYFDDLAEIKKRGVIRLITNANPSHYYLKKGSLYGFEYEMIRNFAKKHLLRVDVILAESQQEMMQLLKEGKGDVIAASLPSGLIELDEQTEYTEAYDYASPVIIGRGSDKRIVDIRDLAGRRITLPHESPYWEFMQDLQQQGHGFELVKADPGINTEGTMLMVALGMYDLTVVGSHEVRMGMSKKIGLSTQLVLSEPLAHRWVVRNAAQQLQKSLNDYIKKGYRKERYNVLHAKYFDRGVAPTPGEERLTRFASLSPYDDLTQRYSEEYGFDWRLITALMFQESRFNPNAKSYAGAKGLMQLIPSTAELMGLKDIHNPEGSIDAGIRYLDYLRNKFEDTLLLEDRMWFTLASYNAGYGRVKKARALAEKMGLDKDRWFGNVEVAMMGKVKPEHNKQNIKYCRCGQAVVYVREIRTRYFNYIRLVDTQMVASNGPSSKRININ